MNLPLIDWIWRVRGSLPLARRLSSADVFEKLDPLFKADGTTHRIEGHRLIFTKKNPLAQDKMSVFDGGALTVDRSSAGPVLRYQMTSKALLFCFLAPLLFLAFAQLTIYVGSLEKHSAEEAKADKKPEKEKKKEVQPQNPVDKFLGAPAPEKPKEDSEDKDEKESKGPSPTPAYVFAGLFAFLYLLGRLLEPWLIKSEFRRRLSGETIVGTEAPLAK